LTVVETLPLYLWLSVVLHSLSCCLALPTDNWEESG